MRKTFFPCLILFAFLLVSCNQVVELPTAAKEISIDTAQISDSSGWMSINHDTKIKDLNLLACNPEVILPPYYSHQEA